jgi:protein gp37
MSVAENSGIQWTDATFNMWRGCARVSPGCEHCYAETLSKRNPKQLGVWGVNGTRVVASEHYWNDPIRWNRKAEKEDRRLKVFCASLADWLEDRPDLVAPRARLCALIEATPRLDWLLLSKRPELFDRLAPAAWRAGGCPPHVVLGVTAESQKYWDLRVSILQTLPARRRFVSCEPLLSPIAFRFADGIHHVIVGGESGHGARPFDITWARQLRESCRAAGVAVFMKQFGAVPLQPEPKPGVGPAIIARQHALDSEWPCGTCFGNRTGDPRWNGRQALLNDAHGGDMAEWPDDLRIREELPA